MHTRAEIDANGSRATLRLGGRTLRAKIVEPQDVVFTVASATPPEPQNPNRGVRKLVVRMPGQEGSIRLIVLFLPGSAAETRPPATLPLEAW